MAENAIKVVVSDPDSGEVLDEKIVTDDYALVCAGRCYLAHVTVHANGTHVVTVKNGGSHDGS